MRSFEDSSSFRLVVRSPALFYLALDPCDVAEAWPRSMTSLSDSSVPLQLPGSTLIRLHRSTRIPGAHDKRSSSRSCCMSAIGILSGSILALTLR